MSIFTLHPPGSGLPRTDLPGVPITPIQDYVDDMIEAGLVHTVHVSERRAFRSCRQRWAWAYGDDLHSRDSVRALEFGQAYHTAMERFYDPATWGKLPFGVLAEHAIAAFRRETMAALERLKKRGGMVTDLTEEDFADRLESGEAMLRHYFDQVAPTTDTFKPIAVEVAFEVALLAPGGEYVVCRCKRCFDRYCDAQGPDYNPMEAVGVWVGLPVTIGGRLDLLGEDLETGELGVLDWKTAATLMTDREVDFLELDDQISTYLLAMHKLAVPARLFWYHEQRKAHPVAPEPLNRKYKGRMYQASKDLPTSYELYRETVEEGDPAGVAAGAYDEYFAWLKDEGPKFWQRVTLRRNNDQLRATEEAIFLEYQDMVSGRVYPNPSRKQCTWCNFYDPCLGKQKGEPYMHTLNTVFFKGGIELSNDSNQPNRDLPKREPGKAGKESSQGVEKGNASQEQSQ